MMKGPYMKFVYATDLHGDEGKYDKALALCLSEKATLLHIGADILPKGYSIQPRQKDFIKKFLPAFIKRCSDNGIRFTAMFGNDDLWTRKPLYRERCGELLDEKPFEIDGFLFSGYAYVPDYPFGLKTACKYDSKDWQPEPYISRPVEMTEKGFEPITDVQKYFADKGTIEDDLRERRASSNEIVAIHSPPVGLGLDHCVDGRRVGSEAIRRWIEREQPCVVLSGHLHESPWVSGKTVEKVEKTIVVQPGQYRSSATVDPSRLETMNEEDFKRWPFDDASKLRAAVISIDSACAPDIHIVDK